MLRVERHGIPTTIRPANDRARDLRDARRRRRRPSARSLVRAPPIAPLRFLLRFAPTSDPCRLVRASTMLSGFVPAFAKRRLKRAVLALVSVHASALARVSAPATA